jgi:hypothetical protein
MGLSAARGKLARTIGILADKRGLQRQLGRTLTANIGD